MVALDHTRQLWLDTRARLAAKGLLQHAQASLALRCPGQHHMWCGLTARSEPQLIDLQQSALPSPFRVPAEVLAARPDVGALLWGGGPYSACLADFGSELPQVFDEQARHIGPMAPACAEPAQLRKALRQRGNVLLWQGVPLCLAVTATRLALNSELLEKCAKAYVLAIAAGGQVEALPWLVRYIANGRLRKDQRRAALAYGRGVYPEESKAY